VATTCAAAGKPSLPLRRGLPSRSSVRRREEVAT
jgi:hypothetical protein